MNHLYRKHAGNVPYRRKFCKHSLGGWQPHQHCSNPHRNDASRRIVHFSFAGLQSETPQNQFVSQIMAVVVVADEMLTYHVVPSFASVQQCQQMANSAYLCSWPGSACFCIVIIGPLPKALFLLVELEPCCGGQVMTSLLFQQSLLSVRPKRLRMAVTLNL